MKLMAVVLAAGKGKRMKSNLYKVLHPVCGEPMVGHVMDVLESLGVSRSIVVVGHGAEAVQGFLGQRAEYALQEPQLGTGHAVLQTEPLLQNTSGTTIVICGDTPLVKTETLKQMIDLHVRNGAAATLLSAAYENPNGYGRIVRNEEGTVSAIVEDKDCNEAERHIKEINAGTYCFDNEKLFHALNQVTNDNAQQEYYLTDVIRILKQQGFGIEAYCTDDPDEVIGVNDRVNLAEAERLMQSRINEQHMRGGVSFIDPAQTYIEKNVTIGADTLIYPGCMLRGKTQIGTGCEIGPQTDITDSKVGNQVIIKHSVLLQAEVEDEAAVGPFAYLRPKAKIGRKAKIGDFVEIKNASIGEESKVSHLSYVGDAKVGSRVNVGCGAITVNYDGYHKHITEIGDDSFVGSNVNLIAPVKIGRGAYVVAGSTITHDVNDDDLAIARERQTNKPGYAAKLKARLQSKP